MYQSASRVFGFFAMILGLGVTGVLLVSVAEQALVIPVSEFALLAIGIALSASFAVFFSWADEMLKAVRD